MELFQLHHPLHATVLCDRKGCEQVAVYLEVDDSGHAYRLCASLTDNTPHASRLPLEPWWPAPAHGDLQTALAKHKRRRPRLIRVIGTPVEQPSPEVCSQPAYVLTCAVGMAPTGYAAHVRHRSGECQGSRHKQVLCSQNPVNGWDRT